MSVFSNLHSPGNDFKALVYEFMANGSLEEWLHNDGSRNLDLIQWLRIVVDVGFAVEYRHFGNELRIVHDDLKPSKVLLDEEMNGNVGDFGLSILFQILKKQFSCNKANHRLHSSKYVKFFFILLN